MLPAEIKSKPSRVARCSTFPMLASNIQFLLRFLKDSTIDVQLRNLWAVATSTALDEGIAQFLTKNSSRLAPLFHFHDVSGILSVAFSHFSDPDMAERHGHTENVLHVLFGNFLLAAAPSWLLILSQRSPVAGHGSPFPLLWCLVQYPKQNLSVGFLVSAAKSWPSLTVHLWLLSARDEHDGTVDSPFPIGDAALYGAIHCSAPRFTPVLASSRRMNPIEVKVGVNIFTLFTRPHFPTVSRLNAT